MNPWTTLANALQALPPSIRRTLYTIVTAAGAFLAIAQIAGWKDLGFTDLDTALKTYALISSPTGVLALANVSGKEDGSGGGFDLEDLDFHAGSFAGWSGDGQPSDDGSFDGAFDTSGEQVDEGSFS
jgi:hypothetical protein